MSVILRRTGFESKQIRSNSCIGEVPMCYFCVYLPCAKAWTVYCFVGIADSEPVNCILDTDFDVDSLRRCITP